jgi:hypothetical protein
MSYMITQTPLLHVFEEWHAELAQNHFTYLKVN